LPPPRRRSRSGSSAARSRPSSRFQIASSTGSRTGGVTMPSSPSSEPNGRNAPSRVASIGSTAAESTPSSPATST
jgi:hypothetical protein